MAKASAHTINRDTVMGCNPEDEMNSRDYLLELRESTGMTRTEFCKYFEIPYRTLQDWELGNRKMPEYLLRLIAYKIKMEELGKKRDSKETSQK